ncbi:MAG: hypothetical protein ACKO37_00055 [Vampirovibrionales bacterium]
MATYTYEVEKDPKHAIALYNQVVRIEPHCSECYEFRGVLKKGRW